MGYRKLKAIQWEFEDGSIDRLEGEDAGKWTDYIASACILDTLHGGGYKGPVAKMVKPPEPPPHEQ